MTKSVICFCYHVSHVLNLGRIPSMLAQKGWHVRWLNLFPASAFPLPKDPGIDYAFEVDLATVGRSEADLYLSPYVGQSSYFPRRAKRVHFLVSLTSLDGVYDKNMFDHYDVIACAGHHHIEEFAALGKERGWHGKLLLPLGYPKLDGQLRQLGAAPPKPANETFTVVFAPTHAYYINSHFSALARHGEQIVESLIREGIKVIFRPHVESWRDQDRPVVDRIISRFQESPLFVVDRSGNYFDTYAQCDLMLTDISGTGFTFSFTFGKPALFFAPDSSSEKGKVGIQFQRRENIGLVVRSIEELVPKMKMAHVHMEFLRKQIADFRDWLIFNPGRSEQYFADNADVLAEGRVAADWRRI